MLALGHWQYVFWINVPLTILAMVMIQFSLPPGTAARTTNASTSSAAYCWPSRWVWPSSACTTRPDGQKVLPSYGVPVVIAAAAVGIVFALWERFARTRLIEPSGVDGIPFLAALATRCARARRRW